MKRISLLLLFVCMLSVLTFAQPELIYSPGGGPGKNNDQLSDSAGAGSGKLNDQLSDAAASCVQLMPGSYNFGDVASGFSSYPAAPFYVLNGCGVGVIVTNVNATGPSFSQTNDCTGITLPANIGYCTVWVTFTPNSLGGHNQQLIVTDHKQNDPNDPMTQTSALSGTGVADVTLKPPSCSFGGVLLGDTAYCTVTVTNNEPTSVKIISITITPPDSEFSESNNCGSSLGTGKTCTITVAFTPYAPGLASAELNVKTNSPDGTPPPVGLTGLGVKVGGGHCPPICQQ